MDPKKAKFFRELLEKRKKEILEEAFKKEKNLEELQDYSSADWLDRATVDKSRDLLMLLENEDQRELLEVEEALQRIREGTYGICESCGKEIGESRLQAIPLTRLCLSCKDREEKSTEVWVRTGVPPRTSLGEEFFDWEE